MPKSSYWIADAEGVYAQVEGADQRDEWTKVRGWREVGEPGLTDQVHVMNENPDIRPGRLPYGSLAAGMDGLGWHPGPPPAPYDMTKDPVLTDQPVGESVNEPAKSKTPAASGAADKKKE